MLFLLNLVQLVQYSFWLKQYLLLLSDHLLHGSRSVLIVSHPVADQLHRVTKTSRDH